MLSSKSSYKDKSSNAADSLSVWLQTTVAWFSRRPLLALVAFVAVLLVGSVFVPFMIIDHFSIAPPLPTLAGETQQMGGGSASVLWRPVGGAGAGGGTQSSFKQHLQEVLGIQQGKTISPETQRRIEQLAQHGVDYAAAKGATDSKTTPSNAQTLTSQQPPSANPPPAPSAADSSLLGRPGVGGLNSQPERQAAVIAAFKHAYNAYESKCMGQDEYHPLSKRCSNWVNAGLTIIDALPTMMLMGAPLASEVESAKTWVTNSMTFGGAPGGGGMISFFETTIRVLGGLISAFDLSGGRDTIYLQRARELGDKLLPAFNTPFGLPRAQVNLANGGTQDYGWTGGASLLAEVATCQMEFASLSQRTGDSKYAAAAQKPIDVLDSWHRPDGLYPLYISSAIGQSMPSKISLGAMGDSAYEYFLKMWILSGKTNQQAKRMYVASMEGVLGKLLQRTPTDQGDYAFLGDLQGGRIERKMDHLACFVPGMLALGVEEGVVTGAVASQHMQAARDLMRTCYASYSTSPSKIGPEVMTFNPGLAPGEPSYKLRPEMIESLFVMWRVTGEAQYREWGWAAFEAIDRHCKVADGGYAALLDVRNPSAREDKMESFFLAETLKYLYLLFSSEDALCISSKRCPVGQQFVFNTECHPIRSWRGD